MYNLKSCCVTKILVPSGIHSEGRWAHAGPDALQGVLKIFHLDVAHLSADQKYTNKCRCQDCLIIGVLSICYLTSSHVSHLFWSQLWKSGFSKDESGRLVWGWYVQQQEEHNLPLIGPRAASLANDVRSLPEYPEVALLSLQSREIRLKWSCRGRNSL